METNHDRLQTLITEFESSQDWRVKARCFAEIRDEKLFQPDFPSMTEWLCHANAACARTTAIRLLQAHDAEQELQAQGIDTSTLDDAAGVLELAAIDLDERPVVLSRALRMAKAETVAARWIRKAHQSLTDTSTDESTWPFKITPGTAAKQLAKGEGRNASFLDEVQWVASNLNNPEAQPKKAPSNGAWNLLLASVEDSKTFWNLYRQAMGSKASQTQTERQDIKAGHDRLRKLLEPFEHTDDADEIRALLERNPEVVLREVVQWRSLRRARLRAGLNADGSVRDTTASTVATVDSERHGA